MTVDNSLSFDIWQSRPLPRVASRDGDHRTAYQRDKARVLHSAAFRRLQAKTQVLGVGLSDFYRTRLTHSLEAAQIGSGIASQLSIKFPAIAAEVDLDAHLIETLCLAHDIGHPPFGHGGETALHQNMQAFGGFEGNAQTFRIVTSLEPYTPAHGMNLSRRTLLGLIKYPNTLSALTPTAGTQAPQTPLPPPKGLYDIDNEWFGWVTAPFNSADNQLLRTLKQDTSGVLRTTHKSFDCSVMELADDIAYGIHDLEDAIAMHLVLADDFWQEVVTPIQKLSIPHLSESIATLAEKLFSLQQYERKNAIGALVNTFITAISIINDERFSHPLLAYQAVLPDAHSQALTYFKQFILTRVIRHSNIQRHEFRGQRIIDALFAVLSAEPLRLLPENTRERWRVAATPHKQMRIIADYMAGMTDEYANRLYTTLFVPSMPRSL